MRSLLSFDVSVLIQQHRLVTMHPNKVRSFSPAIVHTAAVENGEPEARPVRRLGGHTRVSKNGDDGEVEACRECCTHYVGKTKARTWVDNYN